MGRGNIKRVICFVMTMGIRQMPGDGRARGEVREKETRGIRAKGCCMRGCNKTSGAQKEKRREIWPGPLAGDEKHTFHFVSGELSLRHREANSNVSA